MEVVTHNPLTQKPFIVRGDLCAWMRYQNLGAIPNVGYYENSNHYLIKYMKIQIICNLIKYMKIQIFT